MPVLSTAASYNLIASNITRSIDTTAKRPDVAREIDYYLKNIGEVKSIDDFLADTRLFNFAMKAHGLEDMAYAKAFMRKALSEGIQAQDSFVNKLADSRYRDFATTFDFAAFGETATVFEATRQGTVDKYLRQTLETDAGASNEGVRLALYLERKAPTIDSVYDLLADRALLTIVHTTLGLSPTTALADIDKQAQMISARIDIEDFQDPEKLSKFLTRFTTMWEMNNPSTTTPQALASILFSQPTTFGISTDLLLTMQKLKF